VLLRDLLERVGAIVRRHLRDELRRLPRRDRLEELRSQLLVEILENVRCSLLWSLGYRYSFWHRLAALRDARDRADEIIEAIGLAARRDTPAGILTYAEQRALEIGITVVGGADVVLLEQRPRVL
jgi:ABC-type branched-subunit amino acid transport system ATPase component